MTPRLTPAEIKTLRESLGLSAQALGARLGGVADRTIRRWESGQSTPATGDVADELHRLDAAVERLVQQTLEQVDALAEREGAPQQVVLLRYASDADLARHQPGLAAAFGEGAAGLHAVALDRIRVALARRGCQVRLVWFDPAAYASWRRREHRPDHAASRAAWAGQQVE